MALKISRWRKEGSKSDVEKVDEAVGSQKKDVEEESHFIFKSSTLSVWLPCVVGMGDGMLMTTCIANLLTKLFILVISVILVFFSLPLQINVYPSLLWCLPTEEVKYYNNANIEICNSWSDCFKTPDCNSTNVTCNSSSQMLQKLRVCDLDEATFRLYLFAGLVISTLLSAFSSWRLHVISAYANLYQASKHMLWIGSDFIPTTPILHRSFLFDIVDRDDSEQLTEVLQLTIRPTTWDFIMSCLCKCPKDDISKIIEVGSTKNRDGNNLLELAENNNKTKCLSLLIQHGAVVSPHGDIANAQGVHHLVENGPLFLALSNWFCAVGGVMKVAERRVVELKKSGVRVGTDGLTDEEKKMATDMVMEWNKVQRNECK